MLEYHLLGGIISDLSIFSKHNPVYPNIYEELGAITTKQTTSHHEVCGALLGVPLSRPPAAHHEGGGGGLAAGHC